MTSFDKLFHEVICESLSSLDKELKMLQTNLEIINKTLADNPGDFPDRDQYEELQQKYKRAIDLRTIPVTVICYDKEYQYPSAMAAIEHFEEGLNYCDEDSSEGQRYLTIISKLYEGKTKVNDDYWDNSVSQ